MSPNVPEQSKNNSTFLTVMSVLSGVQVIAAGITLLDAVPSDVGAFLFLLVAAANAGITYYLNGKIVPLDRVVAYQPNKFNDHALYAGGAAIAPTGDMLSVDSQVGALAEKVVVDNKSFPDGV